MVIYFWRRLDTPGLERLELTIGGDVVSVSSTVLCAEGKGFRLDYDWLLDLGWRTRRISIKRYDPGGRRDLEIERLGATWSINGTVRDDLQGADELDLSVTPFCNALPVRRLGRGAGSELTLDTVYVDGGNLFVTRSRQRYLRKTPTSVRYIDLGTARGFEADLRVDADGLVVEYERLFERILPSS